jgi:hypothetical protein
MGTPTPAAPLLIDLAEFPLKFGDPHLKSLAKLIIQNAARHQPVLHDLGFEFRAFAFVGHHMHRHRIYMTTPRGHVQSAWFNKRPEARH